MMLVRVAFSLLIVGPLILGIVNLVQNRNTQAIEKSTHFPTLINSGVMYAIAYNLIFFVQELFLVLGKNWLGLTARLYHNNHTWDGTHDMAPLMQGSGALAILVVGLIGVGGLYVARNATSIWKVLLLWLAFQGLIQSISQIVVGYFDPGTDVGQALVGYLHINENLFVALSVCSIVAIAAVSIGFGGALLEMAPTTVDLNCAKSRWLYIRFVAVGAAFLACFLLIPFRVWPITQIIGPFILLVFSIPWMWSMAGKLRNIQPRPNEISDRIRWEPILLLAALLVVFRAVLAPGITIVA